MSKKCLLRVEELLTKSSIKAAKKDEIINQIKIAQAEQNINSCDLKSPKNPDDRKSYEFM